jgi:hypothetical protein
MRWAAWTNVIAGALLAIAPFALGYSATSSVAMTEAAVVGVLIAGIALWSALSTAAPAYLEHVLAVLGGWSVIAPFVLGYYNMIEVARNVDIVAGLVVAAVALIGHFYESPGARQKVAA